MDHARGARLGRAFVIAVSLAAAAPFARAACGGFGAGVSFTAGSSPQAAASGDFDRDGVADLAIANLSGPALTVLRGLGNGTFAAPVAYDAGTAGRAVAVGDFNGDGVPDLAVGVAEGVAIWIGTGNGSFTGGGVIPAGASVRGVACADLDRDGVTDLAVTSSGTNAVLVLRGNGAHGIGDGTFAAPAAYAVGANPARLLVADLDGDGIADLAVANNGGASVSILPGRGANGVGDGTFAAARTLAVAGSPWAVAALDWNGDGIPDLVVSNGAGTSVALLRGTGGGAFAAAGTVTTPTAPRDLVAGDFDGDGRTDVAAACAVGNDVVVLRGTGTGLATLGTFATGSGAGGLAGGDWNGDRSPDLACVNTGAGSVTRLLGSCPPAPGAAVTLLAPLGHETWWPGTVQQVRWIRGAGVTSVNVDLSRDGGVTWLPLAGGLAADHVAIPVVGVPDPHLRVRVADALVPARAAASPADLVLCGLFGTAIASDAGLSATQLAAADVDGDGAPDVVACDAARVVVMHGAGGGRFTPLTALTADSTRRIALADVTGDGLVDLVRLTPSAVGVRAGDGHGQFGAETLRAIAGGTGLAAADFDGDGVADVAVLAADGASSRLVVWRSGAPGVPWSAAVDGAPGALASADLDGDGIADLAVGAGTSVQNWYGTGIGGAGDGAFRAGDVRALPAAGGDLLLADANGDGTPDVIACLPPTGDLVAVPTPPPGAGSATGAAAVPLTVAAGANPRSPVLADLDGDGRPDLVVALAGEGAVAVLPGNGGGFGAPVRFATGAGASALVVDDFNGDGEPDVVVAGTDGRLYCLPAQCPPELPATLTFAPATFADTCRSLAGFARTLAWSRAASIPAVRVELSRDGGAHWTTLADGITAGTYRWIATGPACDGARLRVRDAVCGTRADVGRVFAIRAPFAGSSAGAAPAGAATIATGDADGDGTADAVVAGADRVALLRGNGAGGFLETWSTPEGGVRRVRLADVDGDGVPDLVTLHAAGFTVRAGDGAGGFGPARSVAIENGSTDLVLADLDADGRLDVVTASADAGLDRISVRLAVAPDSAGALAFAAPWFALVPTAPTALAAADLNADGIPDLVVAHAGGFATLLGLGSGGRGTGTFRLVGNRAFPGTAVCALRLADLDGDGRVDVAAADSARGAVLLAAGDGAGGLGAPALFALGGTPVGLAVADIDRDGAPDLAALLADGTLALLRGIGSAPGVGLSARFAPAERFAAAGAAAAMAFVDADGDGVADAVALDGAGALQVLRGRSAAPGAPRLLDAPAPAVAKGDRVTLHWSAPRGVLAADVELSRDGGAHWAALASRVAGGAWTWPVTGAVTPDARLRVRDADVPVACDSASAAFRIDPAIAGVARTVPAALRLGAPWPNPANAGTRIELALPAAGAVRVDVCDVAGRHARTIVSGILAAGTHTLRWAGDGDDDRALAPGMYFVTARAHGATAVRRVVIAR